QWSSFPRPLKYSTYRIWRRGTLAYCRKIVCCGLRVIAGAMVSRPQTPYSNRLPASFSSTRQAPSPGCWASPADRSHGPRAAEPQRPDQSPQRRTPRSGQGLRGVLGNSSVEIITDGRPNAIEAQSFLAELPADCAQILRPYQKQMIRDASAALEAGVQRI